MKRAFYAEGLHFSCVRCSACCRREPGFVWLTDEDVDLLCEFLHMPVNQFEIVYCRRVQQEGGGGVERIALKEKVNCDCVFWSASEDNTGECLVYEARPRQCVIWPFWPSVLASKRAWNKAAAACPGIGTGRLYTLTEIEAMLEEMEERERS